ncbi:MAG: adenylate/guanylate cyclase domain-containing protein [Candidatus Rifleibacteriota bacterium]
MPESKFILKVTSRPNTAKLVLAWLLLVILPAFLFINLFNFVLQEGEQDLFNSARTSLYEEMEDFKSKLLIRRYLEINLAQLSRKLGFNKSNNKKIQYYKSLDATKLRKIIKKELGINVFAAFYHGPDTAKTSHSLTARQAKKFMISRTMLEHLFKFLNKQNKKTNCLPQSNKKPINPDLEKKLRTKSLTYLKNLLKTTGKLELEKNEVKTFLSGNPDLKRIFIYYASAEKTTKVAKANLGGFIIIFRQKDIPVKILTNFATNDQNQIAFNRRIITRNLKSIKNLNKFSNSLSQLNETNSELTLNSVFPSELLVRIICGDTYYPFNLDKTIKNFPLLQIKVNKSELVHPLRKYYQPVKFTLLILVMLVTLLFLRLFFFGFFLPFKIRTKILSAVFAASILPFLALWTMAAYHEAFSEKFRQFEMSGYLNQQLAQFNISTNSYRAALENKFIKLNETLGNLKTYELIPAIKHWMKDKPITHIATRIKRNDGVLAREPGTRMESFELDLKDLLFTTLENAFRKYDDEGKLNDGSIGLFKIKVKGIGNFLSDISLLHNSGFYNIDTLYSLIPVFKGNRDDSTVESAFLLKLSNKLILKDFFRKNKKFITQGFYNGFKIQKCYIPISRPGRLPPQTDYICSKNFPFQLSKDKIEKTLQNKSTNFTIINHNGHLKLIKTAFMPSLKTIVVLVATQITGQNFALMPSFKALSLYLLAIIIAAILLMGRIFVDPVNLFERSTEKLACADFNHRLSLSSKDEFASLAQSFNVMIRGLNEKEKLSQFLSEDVIEEISDNKETILEPGGERGQASIVYCSLPHLNLISDERNYEKVIAEMSNLINTADQISRRHNGVIDKTIENSLMLVFRQSDAGDSHVLAACKATMEIKNEFASQNIRFNAAIASGSVISGKIGSKDGRLDFTVIGNPVNLAARLKSQAEIFLSSGILICPQTIRKLKGKAKLKFIDRVTIKGRGRTFPLYELIKLRD